MYDMAANLSYQHGFINEEEYFHATEYHTKMNYLAECCYLERRNSIQYNTNSMSDDLERLKYLDVESLCELSEGQRINNPSLLIAMLAVGNSDVVEIIPSLDALKDWCYSKHNYFDDHIMQKVANVLGPDFAPEKCREQQEMARQKEREMAERRQRKMAEWTDQCQKRYPEYYHFGDFNNAIDLRQNSQTHIIGNADAVDKSQHQDQTQEIGGR